MNTVQSPRTGTRPTSRDVARAAGVSQATVSLVLADKWRGRVSERTAGAVREAARTLGYRPNLAARNLRLGRTRTALLVVPVLTNEFFGGVYTGVARVAAEHGFGVVLYPSPDGVGRARDPFESARTALDGVIASSMAADALEAIRGVAESSGGHAGDASAAGPLPLVMLDSDPAPGSAGVARTTVNQDMAAGMRQVMDHLLALGHRRITHIAADVDTWTFRERARVFAQAIAAVPGASGHTEPAALSVPAGRAAAERALTCARAQHGSRPTALVCDDDILAAGACKAVRRLGLSVPGDVSVTGFDDLSLATALDPELTTVRLPAEDLGARGMAALLALLEGRPFEEGDLPVRLVVRGSTAPPPRGAPRDGTGGA